MSKEFLKRLELFADLKPEDLDRLYAMTRKADVKQGQVIMKEGEIGDSLYALVDGEFEVSKRSGDQDVVLSVRKAGEVIGEMSLLDSAPRVATVRALTDGHVLIVSQKAFQDVMACSPSAITSVLRTVTSRLRSTETLVVQNEKMAALGTLAAGLAHELNNPAAAAQRSSMQVHEKLDDWQDLTDQIARLALSIEQREKISDLRQEVDTRATSHSVLDPLARSDRETEVQDWLDDHDIDDAWEMAPTLVNFGWDIPSLDSLALAFGEHMPVITKWIVAGLTTYSLLEEVRTSTERISELVKAVKNYSYLDQAPVQQVDITDGLENTLIILKHKLKTGVKVNRDYAPNLPRIEAYGSELNQVWTNLIDNAADAMNGEGEITLRAYAQDDKIVVEIADNGPGIPPEVKTHIFEPFYTTKGPGVGTGLGLHIAYNIVVDKHHGRIEVRSKPGETCFRVTLPTKLARK